MNTTIITSIPDVLLPKPVMNVFQVIKRYALPKMPLEEAMFRHHFGTDFPSSVKALEDHPFGPLIEVVEGQLRGRKTAFKMTPAGELFYQWVRSAQ